MSDAIGRRNGGLREIQVPELNQVTKATVFSDTVEFRHLYLTQPTIMPTDCITHTVSILTCALHDAPSIYCNNQLSAISSIK